MPTIPWHITHSVETGASPAFAWRYWTNVSNWDDPPAKFSLDGPFASGSRGNTLLPGQEPLSWLIREVTPPHSATIEMTLDRAILAFEWHLAALPDGRTRLTQRISLTGDNAAIYLPQVQAAFAANLPAGMNRLAAAMAEAENLRRPA